MELFNRQDTRSFTSGNTDSLNKEISHISDSDILSLNMDELTDYYYSKYSIDTIKILKNDISSTIEETKIDDPNPFYDRYSTLGFEPRTFSVDGYRVNYKIPFEGNISLLYLKPTMSKLSITIMTELLDATASDIGIGWGGEGSDDDEVTSKERDEKNYVGWGNLW